MKIYTNTSKYIGCISKGSTYTLNCLDSHIVPSDSEKVPFFNVFFHSVFTQSSYTIPPLNELPVPITDISMSELNVHSCIKPNQKLRVSMELDPNF